MLQRSLAARPAFFFMQQAMDGLVPLYLPYVRPSRAWMEILVLVYRWVVRVERPLVLRQTFQMRVLGDQAEALREVVLDWARAAAVLPPPLVPPSPNEAPGTPRTPVNHDDDDDNDGGDDEPLPAVLEYELASSFNRWVYVDVEMQEVILRHFLQVRAANLEYFRAAPSESEREDIEEVD